MLLIVLVAVSITETVLSLLFATYAYGAAPATLTSIKSASAIILKAFMRRVRPFHVLSQLISFILSLLYLINQLG